MIDPASFSYATSDTWVQVGYASGQGASEELRAGTFDGGATKARSYLRFWNAPAEIDAGTATVTDAYVRLRNFYSFSCTAGGVRLSRVTQAWSMDTISWTNQPGTTGAGASTVTASHGYSSGCPSAYVNYDATHMVQAWTKGSPNYGFQLRGEDESNNLSWHKFRSVNYSITDQRPRLFVTYQLPKVAPPAPTLSCVGRPSGSWPDEVPSAPVTCTASVASTPSPVTVQVYRRGVVWKTGTPVHVGNQNYTASVTFTLPNKAAGYRMPVRAVSSGGTVTWNGEYTLGWGMPALTQPLAAGGTIRTSDRVFLEAAGPANDDAASAISVQVRKAGGTWTTAGSAFTQVQRIQGNPEAVPATLGRYSGYVDVSKVAIAGTDKRLPTVLEIRICFTYTAGPLKCTDGLGSAAGPDPARVLRVVRVPSAFGAGFPTREVGPGELALWTGDYALSATDVEVAGTTGTLSLRRAYSTYGGQAQAPAGVLGGEWALALDGSDVGLAGMEVIDLTTTEGLVALLDPEGDLLLYGFDAAMTKRTGAWPTPTSGGSQTLVAVDDATAETGVVARVENISGIRYLALTEVDGTVTRFKLVSGGGTGDPAEFRPDSIHEAGQATGTTFAYNTSGRVIRIVAPVLHGVAASACDGDLALLGAGCRVLELTYNLGGNLSGVDLWVGGTPARRIPQVRYDYANPALGTTDLTQVRHVTDDTDPLNLAGLDTSYGYQDRVSGVLGSRRLTTVTPPGLAPFTLNYRTGTDELVSIDRGNPDGSPGVVRVATVAYCAPIGAAGPCVGVGSEAMSGTGGLVTRPAIGTTGLPELGSLVGEWESAPDRPMPVPAGLVGVFGQGRTPGNLGAPTAAEWQYADLSYVDARGYEVYTAEHGAGAWQYTSAEYDSHDQVIRALDADDIATIMAAAPGDRQTVAAQVGTLTVHNAEVKTGSTVLLPAGSVVTDVYEPAREVVLPDGTTGLRRPHTRTTFDQGAPVTGPSHPTPGLKVNPDTGQRWALPTMVTTSLAPAVVTPAIDSGNVDAGAPAGEPVLAQVRTGYDHAVPSQVAGVTQTGSTVADIGWVQGLASSSTVVVASGGSGGADLTTRTAYDRLGREVTTSNPAATAAGLATPGTDDDAAPSHVGTRETIYYTHDSNPRAAACGSKPAWVGWVCQTRYAADPGSPGGPGGGGDLDVPEVLVTETTSSYNELGLPLVVTETSANAGTGGGSVTRTTTTSYTMDGSVASTATVVTGLVGSVATDALSFEYAPSTGLLIQTLPMVGDPISQAYDAWGRQTAYTVGTGGGAETTTTVYNSIGQVGQVTDPSLGASGPAVTSFVYDGGTGGSAERRGLPTQVTVANPEGRSVTITGSYDHAGRLVSQSLPGGVTQSWTYDRVGQTTGVSYAGTGEPGPLTWTQKFDGLGRVVGETLPGQGTGTGTASAGALSDAGLTRAYGYDGAGRLATVVDHVDPTGTTGGGGGGGSCVVREYAFDGAGFGAATVVGNGTRTGLRTTGPDGGGDCQTPGTGSGSGSVVRGWSYDSADRLLGGTGAPYVYDALGRVISLPAVDSPAGSVAVVPPAATPGDVVLGYFDTDAVASITQTTSQGHTHTVFDLDAAGRRAASTTTRTTPNSSGGSGGGGTVVASDEFDRSVSDGWGTAGTGGGWTLTGGGTNFEVDAGTGWIQIPSASAGPEAFLDDVDEVDVDVTTTVEVPVVPTGDAVWLYPYARTALSGAGPGYDLYTVEVEVSPAGVVTLQPYAVVNHVGTAIGSPVVVAPQSSGGVTVAPGDVLGVRLQTEGTSPTTIRARVWETTDPEPTSWQVETTDSTPVLQTSGGVGVGTWAGGITNAPLVVGFDDLTATTLPEAGGPGDPGGDPVVAETVTQRHYTDATDNPGWVTITTDPGTGTDPVVTLTERYVSGLDGNLAATLLMGGEGDVLAGTVQLALTSPHGDVVAQLTLPATGDATGLDGGTGGLRFTDEYGNTLPTSTAGVGTTALNPDGHTASPNGGLGYGWLGAKERATDPSGPRCV